MLGWALKKGEKVVLGMLLVSSVREQKHLRGMIRAALHDTIACNNNFTQVV